MPITHNKLSLVYSMDLHMDCSLHNTQYVETFTYITKGLRWNYKAQQRHGKSMDHVSALRQHGDLEDVEMCEAIQNHAKKERVWKYMTK